MPRMQTEKEESGFILNIETGMINDANGNVQCDETRPVSYNIFRELPFAQQERRIPDYMESFPQN